MLIIRKEQKDAFTKYMVKQFEDRMVIYLRKHFPEDCQKMGEPDLRELIQKGFNDAASYGIEIECDVAKYIGFLFTFGSNFNTDARFAWATEILKDETIRPTDRVNSLLKYSEKRETSLNKKHSPMIS